MRITAFWDRMREQFGPQTQIFAAEHVLGELGQRTVTQALAAGVPAKAVWQAVCVEMEVPARLR